MIMLFTQNININKTKLNIMEGYILSQNEYKQYILFTLDKLPRDDFRETEKCELIGKLNEVSDFKIFTYIHKILKDPNCEINDGNADDYYYIGMLYTIFFKMPEKEILYYSLSVDMGNMEGIKFLIDIYKKNNNNEMEEKYRLLDYDQKLFKNKRSSSDIRNVRYFYERIGKKQKEKEFISKEIEFELSKVKEVKKSEILNFELAYKLYEEHIDVLLKTLTTQERYDILDRYEVRLNYTTENFGYGRNQSTDKKICELRVLLDAYTEEEMLNVISSIKPEDIHKHPKFVQMIYKLLNSNFDLMKLHFEYSKKGKGFTHAKEDFLKHVSTFKSTPE